jgi:hypothetical protein
METSISEESAKVTRFARHLLKILTISDEGVMRLASRAIAYLIQVNITWGERGFLKLRFMYNLDIQDLCDRARRTIFKPMFRVA